MYYTLAPPPTPPPPPIQRLQSTDILVLAPNGLKELKEHLDWPIEQWLFQQANHAAYSNPGTQLGAQTRILALFRRRP